MNLSVMRQGAHLIFTAHKVWWVPNDIYQIAKNCRTSVEMIEKHYAAHIKTALDTSAINVRRERPRPAKEAANPRSKRKQRLQENDEAAADAM